MTVRTHTPLTNGWIEQYSPTTVSAADSAFLPTGQFGGTQINRVLLDFDLSGYGVDDTISAATLSLTVDPDVGGNFADTTHTLSVYRVKKLWRNGPLDEASWNKARTDSPVSWPSDWATAGAAGAADRDATAIGTATITSATSGTVTITLTTAAVQEWMSGTAPYYGLLLVASNETNTTLVRWYSLTAATAANRPTLTVTYTAASHALSEGLLAYWKLDASGYADASGNGHTLTAHNAPSSVTGILNTGAGLARASDQWLSSTDAALKLGDQDWTWIGWVKLTDNADFYVVVANDYSTNAGGGFKLFYHKLTVLDYFVAQLYSADVVGDPVISDVIGYGPGHPPTGTWIFAAVRHDHTRRWLHLFLDYRGGAGLSAGDSAGGHWEGAQCGPYPAGSPHGAPSASTDPWNLGASNWATATETLNGAVDEVGFWSRWLSATDIAAVRDGTLAGTYPLVQGQTVPLVQGQTVSPTVEQAWFFEDLTTDFITVYGRGSSGRADVIVQDNLPCRISMVDHFDAAGEARAELSALRTLYWTTDYPMPPDARVELNHDGRTWNVRPETVKYVQQSDGGLAHWECDLLGINRNPAPVIR